MRGGKPRPLARARSPLAAVTNDRQAAIFNRYVYGGVHRKASLLEPDAFKKNEGGYSVAAAWGALQGVIPVSFADFQLALFHGVAPCAYFELKAIGGQEVRNSHKNCSGYFPKVLYSPDLPTLTGRFSGTKIPRLVRVAVRPACGSFDAPYRKVYFDLRYCQCVQCARETRELFSYTYLSYYLRLAVLEGVIQCRRSVDRWEREKYKDESREPVFKGRRRLGEA